MFSCESCTKSTILKAIHNLTLDKYYDVEPVNPALKVQFWKQFTTGKS